MFGDRVDGSLLREMLLGAAASLQSNKEILNAMNVFPVPDGDTGTNMSLTLSSVVKELSMVKEDTVQAVSVAMARGALKGARGNSGVILSQILRGLANGFDNVEKIDVGRFANSLRISSDIAYKSVMKPKEGTMLTVIKSMSDEAFRSARAGVDIFTFFNDIISAGETTLSKTPDMNPVLKKAGVVDAGGKGLIFIFKAFQSVLNGDEIQIEVQAPTEAQPDNNTLMSAAANEEVDANFPYCTEFFIIRLADYINPRVIDRFREKLSEIGDSLVVVSDIDMIKVHVHTASPGKALQFALQLGEIDKIKIENMLEQNRELKANILPSEPEKEYGIVSVSAGAGIAAIMKDLGVDEIIEGGQTMNPSTEDILNAVEKVNAKSVFILPNNSNIILAAKQVPSLTQKKVNVINTKSIPQGMASVLSFNPDENEDKNLERMESAAKSVKTGLVTFAVRNSNFDGKEINEGDIIGIIENDIAVVGKDYNKVAEDIIDKILVNEEMLTIFYGAEVKENEANALNEKVAKNHSDCEISVYSGGQPLYYYIISAE